MSEKCLGRSTRVLPGEGLYIVSFEMSQRTRQRCMTWNKWLANHGLCFCVYVCACACVCVCMYVHMYMYTFITHCI